MTRLKTSDLRPIGVEEEYTMNSPTLLDNMDHTQSIEGNLGLLATFEPFNSGGESYINPVQLTKCHHLVALCLKHWLVLQADETFPFHSKKLYISFVASLLYQSLSMKRT